MDSLGCLCVVVDTVERSSDAVFDLARHKGCFMSLKPSTS